MELGAWYLSSTASGTDGATGALDVMGICDLYRHLARAGSIPDLVLDSRGLGAMFDQRVFFSVYNKVKNAGGHLVVVDDDGALANFIFALGFVHPVPVVDSLESARQLLAAYAQRAISADEVAPAVHVTDAGNSEPAAAPSVASRSFVRARLARRGAEARDRRPIGPRPASQIRI
jgi:hypothetical protein